MEQEQLEKFRAWFDEYVAGFYGDDEFVNANIRLKEEHSKRVCTETLYLTEELGLSDEQRQIAEAIGLFHDIGRFEQFARYRTYNDPRSVNHCLLGLEVLRKTKALNGLEDKEREIIEKAIEYHGQRQLPADLDGELLLYSRLIRDADKIDVYNVVTDYYRQYRQDPDGFKLEIELPDEPRYSSHVVDRILDGQLIDYNILRTWHDMKLCQLGWVYDVNFAPTLNRIRQRGFLEMILDFLPQTEDIRKVREKIFGYVDSRIEKERGKE
ncbi:MAG: HD domain-containing protein [Planctomycetota bacterium]|jgi:putative nucleotidyltransferase with HDIG domain